MNYSRPLSQRELRWPRSPRLRTAHANTAHGSHQYRIRNNPALFLLSLFLLSLSFSLDLSTYYLSTYLVCQFLSRVRNHVQSGPDSVCELECAAAVGDSGSPASVALLCLLCLGRFRRTSLSSPLPPSAVNVHSVRNYGLTNITVCT